MTIPELEEGIRIAHKEIHQLRAEKHELAENLSELRAQLGIEGAPRPCAPPSDGPLCNSTARGSGRARGW